MRRKNYNASFKAKVALELCKELKTLNEVATKYKVHPNLIAKWKKQMLENLPMIFTVSNNHRTKDKEHEELIASLYQKIGQLEVEIDWLKKNFTVLDS